MTQAASGGLAGEPTRPVTSLVSSVSSQTAAMFPAFGAGALALQMGDDLGFTEAGLGSAVAFFFLLAAVTSPHAGTLTDRLGPQRSLRVANICSAAALLGIALVVQSYWLLLAALGVGAIGLTIAGPGTKTMVARGTDARRHGLFFGVQAAAVPLSVLLAGLAVPAIGRTLGWRWAFGFAVAVPMTGLLLAPGYRARPGHTVRTGGATRGLSRIDYGPLNLIGLAAALGSAAATTMAAFFVSAATNAGLTEGLAGGLLAVASGLPIATRIAAGYLADRFESGHLRIVSLLLGTSTLGYLAAATGSVVLVPAGAMFALGVGWAWSGLMVHSVVRAYRGSPGAATGMTSGGLNVGGVVGPFAFGLLAEQVSYTAGFLTIAACALLAALAADAGRRRLIRAGANP
ncbi:MAG: MFS transporter [Acidimicrobiaceae bacterium]|nr:MFS transporter [Acidimicrobiaceae bacterium]MDE0492587.1 MFS transporter [Acidimicrobiaceae bacterium]